MIAQAGVIRGVKILGLQSRNGRQYLPEALAKAVPLYEGAKVNVNHPKGSPLAPRDYQDRIGVIRGAVLKPDEGLFGDLHFNPKHVLAEQLAWDAEHAPENVGFSHNVQARTSRRDDSACWSRRSCACKASIWWPIRRRRAGCTSRISAIRHGDRSNHARLIRACPI